MQKFFTSLTAVATLTLAAVPALGLLQAAHAAQPVTAVIPVGDLDLSNAAQAAEFHARVDAQAEALCNQIADRSSGSRFTRGACVSQIRLEARRQLSWTQRADLRRSAAPAPMQVAAR